MIAATVMMAEMSGWLWGGANPTNQCFIVTNIWSITLGSAHFVSAGWATGAGLGAGAAGLGAAAAFALASASAFALASALAFCVARRASASAASVGWILRK